MTVEEGAEKVMSIFRCMLIETVDGRVLTGIDLMNRIAEALRDQIEECAKIADLAKQECERITATTNEERIYRDATIYITGAIEQRIRALATPTEDNQPNNRFDLGGFECNEKQED